MFVAVGDYGLILTSPDGEEWTIKFSYDKNFRGVTFGGGRFVAIGENGLTATSTNGKEWISENSGLSLDGVAYGNGTFVATNPHIIATSPDGITWTPRPIIIGGASQGGYSVAFGNGLFVIGSYGQFFVSPDGVNWTRIIDEGPGITDFYTGRKEEKEEGTLLTKLNNYGIG